MTEMAELNNLSEISEVGGSGSREVDSAPSAEIEQANDAELDASQENVEPSADGVEQTESKNEKKDGADKTQPSEELERNDQPLDTVEKNALPEDGVDTDNGQKKDLEGSDGVDPKEKQDDEPLKTEEETEKTVTPTSETEEKERDPKELTEKNDKPLEDEKEKETVKEKNDGDQNGVESSDKEKVDPSTLQYGDAPFVPYDENKSKLENAKDDVDFAKQQIAAYDDLVKRGEMKDDSTTREQLDDALKYAQDKYDTIKKGNDYNTEGEYLRTEPGQKVIGVATSVGLGVLEKITGVDLPDDTKDNIKESMQNVVPNIVDKMPSLAENMHDQFDTKADRFKQAHDQKYFMRDADGNPITAEEGAKIAFEDTSAMKDAVDEIEPATLSNDIAEASKGDAEASKEQKDMTDLNEEPLDLMDGKTSEIAEKRPMASIDDIRNISEKTDGAKLSDEDKASFEKGEFETLRLNEPLTAYRYFGAYSPNEIADIKGIKEEEAKWYKEWGSDAGGRYLSLDPNLTADEAKDALALKDDWGNNAVYVSKIEIPAGTEIAVGKAASQVNNDGTALRGGETQILLPKEWTTENNAWIKECKPIGEH